MSSFRVKLGRLAEGWGQLCLAQFEAALAAPSIVQRRDLAMELLCVTWRIQ